MGDPIELRAAGAAYGRGRAADSPLLIGSVKTNFGHLESAAGVAGLMKVLLAMKHGVIPKHLHFRNPTPEVDWDQLPLHVTAEATAWPAQSDRPVRAGVSGFGWSGTNAHVVLEAYPAPADSSEAIDDGVQPAGLPQSTPVPDAAAAAAGSASRPVGTGPVVVEELQLHSAMVLPHMDSEDASRQPSQAVQVLLDDAEGGAPRPFEVYSRAEDDDGWTLHVEGRASTSGEPQAPSRIDLDGLKAGLTAEDASAVYRARADASINLGPLFRTLQGLWSGEGEALGEVVLPEAIDPSGLHAHPILLDGCFQVMAAARNVASIDDGVTYLPFGWERLWLTGPLPKRLICHARMRPGARDAEANGEASGPAEVLAGDLRLYTTDGEGFELRCPREYEAQIIDYASAFAVLVDFETLQCPVKVIGADPTLPYSYLPTFDLSHVLTVDYDFLPETTHFLQLEQPQACADAVRGFLSAIDGG